MEERPPDGVDLLETSLLVKRTANAPKLSADVLPARPDPAALAAARTRLGLYGAVGRPVDPETGEAEGTDPPNDFEAEDLALHAHLLDSVGCGLGKSECYAAMLALRRLGEDSNLGVATARLFGKFLGTHADYWVFETTLADPGEGLPEPEEGSKEVPPENGTGANAFTYFFCTALGGPFTRLPDVSPAAIRAARKLRKLLTGNPAAPVSAYPPFPGREAELLRAQIARIGHATVLAPAGMFEYDEDEARCSSLFPLPSSLFPHLAVSLSVAPCHVRSPAPAPFYPRHPPRTLPSPPPTPPTPSQGAVAAAEEFEPPAPEDLATPEAWAHRLPHLKMQGRCEVHRPDDLDDEDDPRDPTPEEAEEGPEPLASAAEDAPALGSGAWTAVTSSLSAGVKFRVVGLRSNLWPGAAAACAGSTFANIYVGWGLKHEPYVPAPPPPVAFEFNQRLLESVELPPRQAEEEEE